MRIAMYTDTFYPNINGVSTSVVNLALALAKQGHQIFIQAPKYNQEADYSWLPENIELNLVKSFNAKIYPDFRIGTGLPLSLQAIRKFKPDVIHIHTPLSIGIEGTLIAKALKTPHIHTLHMLFMKEDSLKIVSIKNQRLLKLIYQGGWKFTRTFCNGFNGVIAPSSGTAKELHQKGVHTKIATIPNIVSDDVFVYKKPFTGQRKNLLYVSRLSHEKRINLTLKVLAKLLKTDPNYHLILIGDGPARQELFDLSLKLGIAHAITWYGSIDHQRLIQEHYYHLGDVFVLSSRLETQGLSTLEAMAHGLPVVAVASPTNSEIIGTGGVVVPNYRSNSSIVSSLARAIDKVASVNGQPYSKQAYGQAQQFRAANLLPAYLDFYQEIADRQD